MNNFEPHEPAQPDPFEHDDAAYVLGALDPADAAAFEQHLGTCAACRERVHAARQTVAVLRAAEPAEPAEPAGAPGLPDTLLPALVRDVRREQHRRRVLVTSLAAVAAACVLALVVVVWPAGSTTAHRQGTSQAMSTIGGSPIRATALLTDHRWGTSIDLRCRYAKGIDSDVAYRLRVIDRAGATHDAGSWQLAPGGVTDFVGGTEVRRGQIRTLQVTLANGQPVLQLAVH